MLIYIENFELACVTFGTAFQGFFMHFMFLLIVTEGIGNNRANQTGSCFQRLPEPRLINMLTVNHEHMHSNFGHSLLGHTKLSMYTLHLQNQWELDRTIFSTHQSTGFLTRRFAEIALGFISCIILNGVKKST